ncbi:aldehyde dehydrogenase family protein [Aquimarina sp. BL5]|uniref:aldehyde dehydrogenase family protein n=1 Tax=Aquimarina sp. BL5 TaxID=1714860 RepID=UPI000E4A728B|nr:aldehyde dehydrogenase family protein [Aquimarina sp. BL5]AXT50943.1 aldehyde dehydrogenase family protein [Aquimarina sp. BL5]RKN01108.1 aldehyde dehydrogenase family protein [Aquimarina sp. BL5]
MNYQEIINTQKAFFNTNTTKDISFRVKELKRLKSVLQKSEELLYQAIYQDFKKSKYETYTTELAIIYHEIDLALVSIKKWSKRKSVSTGLANLPGRSYIIPEPFGTVLVMGAWNYPYQLSIVPAIAAIAAGCTVILKPSEIPSNSSSVMAKIIGENFDSKFFKVIEGGVKETTELLKIKFDKIFFTGSIQVGKIVYQAAAKHLTPVTLELGGKSPAIITKDVNIDMTAKRLVWAKFLNTGQTCIAPDYIMVASSVQDQLLLAIKKHIESADYKIENQNYTQIVNQKNFERLQNFIEEDKVYFGGHCDAETRVISPTVMSGVTFSDKVMQEEIFGPILPVISFDDLDNAIADIKTLSKPLSCYIFTKNKAVKNKILNEISFGGGAVNDAVMHFMEQNLPFGGVGDSGMGNYHGKAGFETFSHYKSILQKSFLIELNLKYSPYTSSKLKWLKRLIG